jgi:bacterioferritin
MAEIIRLLNQALATELSSVRKCKRRYYASSGPEREQVRERFLERAIDEAQSVDAIAERICELGGHPEFQSAIEGEASSASSISEMIAEEVTEERASADLFAHLILSIGDGDPVSRRLLERILVRHQRDVEMM